MKMKYLKLLSVLFFAVTLSTCVHVAAITDVSAQVAGALGVIDQDTANAISQSAQAIGRAAEEITPEQEYFLGRAVAANILVSYRIWTGNPGLTMYLNRICSAIAINSPRPYLYNGYHVNILDTNEINAFATPGGHIFITRGLIACADSEDALAAVIAHELAHIQLQHGVKAIRNSRITQAVMITGTNAAGAAAGMNLVDLTNVFNESVNEIVSTMITSGYSQSQEFEADTTALALLAATGYDPSGLVMMLRAIERASGSSSSGFGKTHPSPAQRIANVERGLNQYRVQDTRSYRQARYATAVR